MLIEMIIVILLQRIDFHLQYTPPRTTNQAGSKVSLFGTGEPFRIKFRTDIEIRGRKPEMEFEPAAVHPVEPPA